MKVYRDPPTKHARIVVLTGNPGKGEGGQHPTYASLMISKPLPMDSKQNSHATPKKAQKAEVSSEKKSGCVRFFRGGILSLKT